jgi:hypothetical protein
MLARNACRLRFAVSKFAVSEANSGAVLNGLMIGSSAPMVSRIASRRVSICALPPRRVRPGRAS